MRYISLLLTLTVTLPACRHADYMRHELQTNCVKVMRARLKNLPPYAASILEMDRVCS